MKKVVKMSFQKELEKQKGKYSYKEAVEIATDLAFMIIAISATSVFSSLLFGGIGYILSLDIIMLIICLSEYYSQGTERRNKEN